LKIQYLAILYQYRLVISMAYWQGKISDFALDNEDKQELY